MSFTCATSLSTLEVVCLSHFSRSHSLNCNVIFLTYHLWMQATQTGFVLQVRFPVKQTLRWKSACRKLIREFLRTSTCQGKGRKCNAVSTRALADPTRSSEELFQSGVRGPGLSTLAWTNYGMWAVREGVLTCRKTALFRWGWLLEMTYSEELESSTLPAAGEGSPSVPKGTCVTPRSFHWP